MKTILALLLLSNIAFAQPLYVRTQTKVQKPVPIAQNPQTQPVYIPIVVQRTVYVHYVANSSNLSPVATFAPDEIDTTLPSYTHQEFINLFIRLKAAEYTAKFDTEPVKPSYIPDFFSVGVSRYPIFYSRYYKAYGFFGLGNRFYLYDAAENEAKKSLYHGRIYYRF